MNTKIENNNMQQYYASSSEAFCQQQNANMQSNQQSANNMSYWNQTSSQQQLTQHNSPDQLNYGNASYSQNAEPVHYHAFQSNGSNIYSHNTHTNFNGIIQNGNSMNSQDIYQYSPYSGDLLQPEDIFQMDQPIRSANVSSLNDLSTSPPVTLLDLGSGTIESKQISNYSELSESYYSLHDDNSTNSSHNADSNCYYQNINEQMHVHNAVVNGNNNNNNNSNMISMNTSSPPSFEHATYYCDTRNDAMTRQYAKHIPTIHSPTDTTCERIDYANSSASYSSNNNNNNNNSVVNNNIHGNFKNHKRKASESFPSTNNNHFNTFHTNVIDHHHEYYGNSVEHLSTNLTNLELQQNHDFHSQYANPSNCNSSIISEYCNDGVSSNPHTNQCLTYYDNETNNLVQLSTNSYEISVVSTN